MSEARAQDDESNEIVVPHTNGTATPGGTAPPRQVIVIVQQQQQGGKHAGAPRIGDPPDEVESYLRGLRDKVTDAKDAVREARGDDDQVDAARAELRDAQRFYSDERSRLTKQDSGLLAGGAVLTGVGGAALVASAVLAVAYALSGITFFDTTEPDSNLGYAALGCLGGGLAAIGAGIPMIVVGVQRVPKEPGDAFLGPADLAPPPGGPSPVAGLTMRVAF
jgi:hypothetical protein